MALADIYLPGFAGPPPSHLLPLTALLGFVAFLPALAVWSRYCAAVASAGGLYRFTLLAAGPRWAAAQAGIWALAYLLYLPYTVAYLVYLELPAVLHLPPAVSAAVELLLPALAVLVAARAERALLLGLAAFAGLQMLALVLWLLLSWRPGALPGDPGAWLPAGNWHAWLALLAGSVQLSSLLVCLSLVVFLGGDAAGGTAIMPRILRLGAVLAGAAMVVGAVGLALAPGLSGAYAPGPVLAGWPAAFRILALASVLGVVLTEFVALLRLGRALPIRPPGGAFRWVAGIFLLGAAVSLLGPARFYQLTLPPSLLGLWLSLLIVFAAYPWFARRRPQGLRASDVVLALLACGWAGFGLYGVVHSMLHGL